MSKPIVVMSKPTHIRVGLLLMFVSKTKEEVVLYKLVIFDKDGTLTYTKYGHTPCSEKEQMVDPSVVRKVTELHQCGCKLAIATNQGGVAWGYLTEKRAYEIAWDAAIKASGGQNFFSTVMVCPYDKSAPGPYGVESELHKPRPGMLLAIMSTMKVGPEETLFVGDQETDKQAAENAGCDFMWVSDFFEWYT